MTTATEETRAGADLRSPDAEARKQAARLLGKASTPAKVAAARENIKLAPKKPLKRLADIPCTCGAGDSLEHKSTCARGRTIRRRRKLGQPLT
jgi:hypothetical protein